MQLSFSVADAILKISTDMKNTRYAFCGHYPTVRFPFCSISGVFLFSLFIYITLFEQPLSCFFFHIVRRFWLLRFLFFHKFPQFFSFHYTDLTVSAADPFFLVKILEHRSHCRPVQSKGICQFAVRIGHDSS